MSDVGGSIDSRPFAPARELDKLINVYVHVRGWTGPPSLTNTPIHMKLMIENGLDSQFY